MVMVLGGCPPTRVQMANEVKGYTLPADVIKGKGLIYIVDTSPQLFPISKAVFLDGDDDAAKIGTLQQDTYIYFYVLPGHHRIKIPAWSPYEMIFEVEEGDILFLQPVMNRQHEMSFGEVDGVIGRYNVKRMKPGMMSVPDDH